MVSLVALKFQAQPRPCPLLNSKSVIWKLKKTLFYFQKMFPCGTEVTRCQPFCQVVSAEVRKSTCDFCLSPDSLSSMSFQKCSGCKFVYYCSVTCQRKAWKSYHRQECLYLRKVMPKYPPDTCRLIARIVLKLRQGGMREAADLPNGEQRYFDDLMSHQREIVRDSHRIEAFQSFYEVLNHCFNEFCPPKNEVLEIYCRVLINSFNIMNDDYQSIGIGLYLSASVLDHSCDPNATVLFEGKNLILRTIKDVKKFEDLRISYTHLLGNVCFLLCISVLSVGFFKKCKKMPEDILENTRKYYVIGKRKEKHR